MAKPAKSGLGRGLNSLLGGSYEEAAAPAPAPRTMVEPDRESHDRKQPTLAKTPIPQESVSVYKEEAGEPQVVAEDSVTIKGVVSRDASPAPEPASKAVPEPIAERVTDEVPLECVQPNPDQPRTNFKQEDLEELAASIERDGVLQPILVRVVGENSYQIIAGERRWQACKSIGLKTVPIRIKEATDDEALELALIENIQRSDLNPIEEAYGYRRVMERQNLTQSELAQMLSKGRSTIANALRLLELPEDAQQLLFEEKITAGHARAILSVTTKEGRQKLTEKLLNEKLSVRETEAIARLLSAKPQDKASKRQPAPKSFKMVARSLREQLSTNVRVKTVQGKNKIEIEFKDETDLERIFKQLTEAPAE